MGDFEILRFAGADSLAQAAAGQWLQAVRAGSGSGASHGVALSGGRIAGRLFTAVKDLAKREGISLSKVDFFWADERCVPPTDPESNFGLSRRLLFDPLAIQENRIHRVRGENKPEQAALEAEEEILRLMPRDSAGQPVLDTIFLGMGENAHVASLFPGESEETMASPAVYRAVIADKPPPRRITLGYAAIAAARQVWVLISGAGKNEALRQSLDPAGQTPLARVLQSRCHTRVLTDLPKEFLKKMRGPA